MKTNAEHRKSNAEHRRVARRAVVAGCGVFVVSALLVCSPLLLGRNGFNKYIVAFGLVGAFAGMSFVLHGTVDWLRVRK